MYFTEKRIKTILDELQKLMYPDHEMIPDYFMRETDSIENGIHENPQSWRIFKKDERWGGIDKHYWFKTKIIIPDRFEGKKVVYEVRTGRENEWDALNPQFIIYVNGELVQGLDVNHREIIISECATPGVEYEISLYAYSGMKDGLVELNTRLAVLDSEIEKLYFDIKVPYEVAILQREDDKNRLDILKYLNNTINMLDLRIPFSEDFYRTLSEADHYLENDFYKNYCGKSEVKALCVGNTHIDVAWLWTLAQTREKAARSFSTVLRLMEQYPEYIFMSSEPQLYEYIKEDHPDIYDGIKKMVKQGNWEGEGAMWLEADCNLSSGESLVRQLLFGKRFFNKEFGTENRILWLPDAFGYSAALPQILKKSGVDYFMTIKISWNEYNKMPYDSFMWRGIDGTEILTHFITTCDYAENLKDHRTTYTGDITPIQIMGAWKRYQQKDMSDEVLVCFGHGDGGGGPTKEMLENARRMEKGIPGCPKVVMSKSVDFFESLEKKSLFNSDFPKWVGELYLEYHRGTYTSMARNKKFNRKSEFLFQDAEWLSSFNTMTDSKQKYPQLQINGGWKTILLNQFHDILPGSSIKEVYEDSRKQYLEVFDSGEEIVNKAIHSIASKIGLKEESIVVFNSLPFDRSDIVKVHSGSGGIEIYDAGKRVPVQYTEDGQVLFYAQDVPSKGYKVYKVMPSAAERPAAEDRNIYISQNELKNRYFDIKLDAEGNFISIYDLENKREVLKKGERGNVLQAFEDKPARFDAWNIDIYYRQKMWEVNEVTDIKVLEAGPVRGCLQIKKKFLNSVIIQNIYIYNDIPRIDFDTTVDWKEKQVLLKAAFPVDIHTEKAVYEIQYGNVERPTHWNTSWDYARFEVCAHKWVDLSEDDYGVSLMNDCKYGHDVKDQVMRLTLIKSGVYPNEYADQEVHKFVYCLYPHCGDWKCAGTVQQAYKLNCPMYSTIMSPQDGELPTAMSLIKINCENVIAEVVKKAEDSDDWIVRLYECYNRRSNVRVKLVKELAKVAECDLMENEITEIKHDNDHFDFEIKPYEIKTFKFRLK